MPLGKITGTKLAALLAGNSSESCSPREMKTSKEIEREFRADLKALLGKYNASLDIQDKGSGYLPKFYINAYIPSAWENHVMISQPADIDLGSSFDA